MHLIDCQLCSNTVEAMAHLPETAFIQAEKTILNKLAPNAEKTQPVPFFQRTRMIRNGLLGLAASITLIFVVRFSFGGPSPMEWAQDTKGIFYSELVRTSRSGQTVTGEDNSLILAEKALKEGDYATAIASVRDRGDSAALEVLAESSLKSGNYSQAAIAYQRLILRSPNSDRNITCLGMTYLCAGHSARGQQILEMIAKRPDSEYSQQAAKLLMEAKHLKR